MVDASDRVVRARTRRDARARDRAADARNAVRPRGRARATTRCSSASRRSRRRRSRSATSSRRARSRCSRRSLAASTLASYEVRQVFFPSKDGTRLSMFLVHRRGLPRDGRRPVVLYGLRRLQHQHDAGVRPVATSCCSSAAASWPSANLRGGGEYGEAWHQAGMLDRKQNVFDDFIAARRVADRRAGTRAPEKLAIQGGSNGGLLVGAVMTQRPDLFGGRRLPGAGGGHAALPPVHGRPLLDPRVRLRRRPAAVPVPARATRRTTT